MTTGAYDRFTRDELVRLVEAKERCLVDLERQLLDEQHVTGNLRAQVAQYEETVAELRGSRQVARGVAQLAAAERGAARAQLVRVRAELLLVRSETSDEAVRAAVDRFQAVVQPRYQDGGTLRDAEAQQHAG